MNRLQEREGIALETPEIGQALGFRQRGEHLGVQEFIPEASVERFCKAVLPWGSWLDIGRAGGDLDGAADVVNGLALGDQLLSGFELTNDLIRCMADSFHGGVPGIV